MTTQPALPIETNTPQKPAQAISEGPKDLVIASGCSRFELHRLEIIRPKVAVDEQKWVDIVEATAQAKGMSVRWASKFAYEEAAAGFWHLRLYWKEIEITENSNGQ